ncbi:MAG: hypothetical protein ACUVV5_05365 [Candidatus Aminicenantales bacterium]
MLRLAYLLMVFYWSLHLVWYLFRQKKWLPQASVVLVLTLFLLRLLWIK